MNKREHIRQILTDVVPMGATAIARTASAEATDEEIINDVAELVKEYSELEKIIKTAKAPSLIRSELNLGIKAIRDIYDNSFESVTVSGKNEYELVKGYMEKLLVNRLNTLKLWTDKSDIFSKKKIDEQLAKALDRKVWLPSGGSLVFDRTEAMTVVDVNTGRFVGDGSQSLEETVTENNLEAAEELIRQLRLRDIGGIIVVDFIDMNLKVNQNKVLDRLIECLSRDRTRYQVTEVTPIGLVQITRKRIGTGLIESFSKICEHCDGRGYTISKKPVKKIHTTDADFGGRKAKTNRDNVAVIPEKRNDITKMVSKVASALDNE
jgi:ribonuclease E